MRAEREDQSPFGNGSPSQSQKAYVQKARAWTAEQATRLLTDEATILRAIRTGLVPEDIEALSGVSFLTALAGRSTVPKDRQALATLEKLRGAYAEPRGNADKPIAGTMRAQIDQYHRGVEATRRSKKRAA